MIYFRAKNTLKNNCYHNFNHQIHITPPSYQIYMIPCSAFNLFYIWNVMRGNRISYKNLVRAKIYIIPRPSIQETSIVCQPQNHNHISSLGNVVIATFTSIWPLQPVLITKGNNACKILTCLTAYISPLVAILKLLCFSTWLWLRERIWSLLVYGYSFFNPALNVYFW